MRCPNPTCGEENPATHASCDVCGTPLMSPGRRVTSFEPAPRLDLRPGSSPAVPVAAPVLVGMPGLPPPVDLPPAEGPKTRVTVLEKAPVLPPLAPAAPQAAPAGAPAPYAPTQASAHAAPQPAAPQPAAPQPAAPLPGSRDAVIAALTGGAPVPRGPSVIDSLTSGSTGFAPTPAPPGVAAPFVPKPMAPTSMTPYPAVPPASIGNPSHGGVAGLPPPVDLRPAGRAGPTGVPGPEPTRLVQRPDLGPLVQAQPQLRGALFEYRGVNHTGYIHTLRAGRNVLGRDPSSCDIVVDDERVSKQHAFLFIRGDEVSYLDISSNGSVIDGRVVHGTEAKLQSNTVIELGASRLVFLLVPQRLTGSQA